MVVRAQSSGLYIPWFKNLLSTKMHFFKTLFLAALGFGAMTFAAPADAGVADPAAIQAIQDACDRIPYEERHRRRECEDARLIGDRREECYEIRRSGARAPDFCHRGGYGW